MILTRYSRSAHWGKASEDPTQAEEEKAAGIVEKEEAKEAGEEVEGAETGAIDVEGVRKCRRPRSRGRLIGGGYRSYASGGCSTAVTECVCVRVCV